MYDIPQILNTFESPSVKLLRLKSSEKLINFLINIFPDGQGTVSSENIHTKLTDFLEENEIKDDESDQISSTFDTYEQNAKRHIQDWTNKGFLTNYLDQQGEVYELSTHSHKAIDWLASLKKEEFVGTESKFSNILYQLKELVEFTNENVENRLQLLEEKKLEIEQQIQRIKTGEDVKVFEEFEIIPRFNQINQLAKELLSDFKEVEDNFKEITKGIYQKYTEKASTKSDILEFAFEAIDELRNSQQGKSFYAFYNFLWSSELQNQWESLIKELYKTLEQKAIPINDPFLKGMKKYLYSSGQKVYKANDKMADKLSRIICENEASKSEATKKVIQQIKKQLIEISKAKKKPDISFELETEIEINLPFERKLTAEQGEEIVYTHKPRIADQNIIYAEQSERIYSKYNIDKNKLRENIKTMLKEKSQTTLLDIIENYGGLKQGLPELFAYISILKEFNYVISPTQTQDITFDVENRKQIKIPQIILTR